MLREPQAWTEADVTAVLEGMLRALERAKDPDAAADRPVVLCGFSWIVSPFEAGGVVIALELGLGAVVAGPFDVPERELSRDHRARDQRAAQRFGHGSLIGRAPPLTDARGSRASAARLKTDTYGGPSTRAVCRASPSDEDSSSSREPSSICASGIRTRWRSSWRTRWHMSSAVTR